MNKNKCPGYPNVKNYDGSLTEWGNMIALGRGVKNIKILKPPQTYNIKYHDSKSKLVFFIMNGFAIIFHV
jgi:hypothetical protein